MQPRKKRKAYNDPGHAHELTFSCYRRLPLLNGDPARFKFLEVLDHARRECDFSVWAYVLMPEHVHLLIHPHQATYAIADILSAIKTDVARSELRRIEKNDPLLYRQLLVRERDGTHRRFWQSGGGYDRNLYTPQAIRASLAYIHENPLRRGLAGDMLDWPWSSARFYAGMADVVFECDPVPVPL
ncbi:MAG: hypothetical protein AKCLJLPJ_01747 [Fimbriimonadales bacterium]|nr:MAG: hypothetical protein EDM73_12995 [Armatimonadota bacterium]MBV6503662.1 hypothetical protein [Fimbriimonadales bacterium]MCE7900996.1 hypothetical protein [Armatimonadetes bacterium ATM1]MDL1929229.1 hypothetical protein [Fimbriimonadia bacterium ATM]MBC6970820.1 hypothetical protein [Armatimonadota bacterium]